MGLYTKIALTLGLAAAVIFGYLSWEKHQQGIGYQEAKTFYTGEMEKQKAADAETLRIETGKVRESEAALNTFKNEQELKDGKSKTKVAELERSLRLAARDGRLRDPDAKACGERDPAQSKDSTDPGNRLDDGSEAGGVFSKGATGLLLRLTKEADDVNAAYASCREDSLNLREVLK